MIFSSSFMHEFVFIYRLIRERKSPNFSYLYLDLVAIIKPDNQVSKLTYNCAKCRPVSLLYSERCIICLGAFVRYL